MSWFTSSASSIIRGIHRRERKLSLWLRRHEDDETCNLKWFKDKNPFTQSLLHASIRTNILWITSALPQTFSRFKCVDFCSSQFFFPKQKNLNFATNLSRFSFAFLRASSYTCFWLRRFVVGFRDVLSYLHFNLELVPLFTRCSLSYLQVF